MNTHFIKIISGIALILTLTQFSLANSNENTDTAVQVDKKKKELDDKVETINLTSKLQAQCRLKKTLPDWRAKEPSGFFTSQSFLGYQVNGKALSQAFRIKNRVACAPPDALDTNDNKR